MRFEAKTVWITGASSGIGEALAYGLSTRGARLVLSARREEELERVRQACERLDDHLALPLDLARPDTFADATAQVLARYGHLDVLVNNGGLSQRSRVADTELDVIRHIMEVNFFGTVALTQAVLPSMLDRGAGHIVVVSSLLGKFSTPKRSAYAASKHALHGFFDALRAEVWDAGLRVTMICPGYVRTQVSDNALTGDGRRFGRTDRAIAAGMPAGRCARAIAKAVERERDEVYIAGREQLALYVKRFAPPLFNLLVRRLGTPR